jgi:hypothetical protein
VWEEIWTNTRTSFSDGNVNSGDIGLPIRSGDEFTLSTDFNCQFNVTYKYNYQTSVPSRPLLSYQTSYTGTAFSGVHPDSWSEQTSSFYSQKVNVSKVP